MLWDTVMSHCSHYKYALANHMGPLYISNVVTISKSHCLLVEHKIKAVLEKRNKSVLCLF